MMVELQSLCPQTFLYVKKKKKNMYLLIVDCLLPNIEVYIHLLLLCHVLINSCIIPLSFFK